MANLWTNIGVNYVTFNWPEDGSYEILNNKDTVMKIVREINKQIPLFIIYEMLKG